MTTLKYLLFSRKDLLRESGAMDERDVAAMDSSAAPSQTPKLPTANDLFKKRANEKNPNEKKRIAPGRPSNWREIQKLEQMQLPIPVSS